MNDNNDMNNVHSLVIDIEFDKEVTLDDSKIGRIILFRVVNSLDQ